MVNDWQRFDANDKATWPKKGGKYLLRFYEWVGLPKDKPAEPDWDCRTWHPERIEHGKKIRASWGRKAYYWDTGGYENFEPLAWAEVTPPSAEQDTVSVPRKILTQWMEQATDSRAYGLASSIAAVIAGEERFQ